ncbi:flagellar hook capping FlgD N-terminal domain-containing protein [Tropicimonas sp. S265A]|uniref:flagellar hook capping FlgD N-terminal domain-containing protein n=1 Tax=Tropicimonas sp. S265A TaxID=3415134 RepID=UPI003C7E8CBC
MDAIASTVPNTVRQSNVQTGQSSGTAINSDYETFLLMLTTQLENQDPTDPADSDELAVQLATFSGVEQQTLTNDLLKQLTAQTSLGNIAQMGSWVGMEVLASGAVGFEGQPIDLEVAIPGVADNAQLVVSRPDGTEVQRLPLDLTDGSFTWAGVSSAGQPLPNGTYQFTISATAAGQPVTGGAVSAYREVAEVRSEGTSSVLIATAGDRIDSSAVLALRRGDEG